MISFLTFALPLSLYLCWPSTLWNFDGVACAGALELGNPVYLFHANHLLYGFLGFLFWKWVGIPLGLSRALPALQLLTSLLSAAGLWGVYRLLRAQTMDSFLSFLITLTLGVTAAFWVWSVEAQVYPLGFLGLAWATCVLLHGAPTASQGLAVGAAPTPDATTTLASARDSVAEGRRGAEASKYRWVGLLHGGAVLGHVLHTLWLVPALYWIWRAPGLQRVKQIRTYLVTFLATVLIPYLFVILFILQPQKRGGDWFLTWLKGSAGLTPDRHWAWHSAGWTGPWVWLKATFAALWGVFWPYGNTPLHVGLWILTGLSAAGCAFLLARSWVERANPLWGFSLAWLVVYGIFLWTWEPGTLCYRMTDVIPLGILFTLGIRGWRSRTFQAGLAGILLLTTLAVNWATRIQPMNQAELNNTYMQTLDLAKTTPAHALYLTGGGLPWIYLLYFTGRTAWNVNAFEPGRLAEAIAREKRKRPVYVQKGSSWHPIP